jgi:hypothetical protein
LRSKHAIMVTVLNWAPGGARRSMLPFEIMNLITCRQGQCRRIGAFTSEVVHGNSLDERHLEAAQVYVIIFCREYLGVEAAVGFLGRVAQQESRI